MFCIKCGIKNENDAQFCQGCGIKADNSVKNISSEKQQIKIGVKNYSPIFWKYFWVGFLLNIFSKSIESADSVILWIIFLILVCVYIYKFSETINEAMLSIGKKNWWPLGLLFLIPFGFWIAFLIVRAKLKPYGKWVSEHRSFKMSKK